MADFSDFYPPLAGGGSAMSYSVVAVSTVAAPFKGYYVDTTAEVTMTLPVGIQDDIIFIGDGTGNAELMNIVILPNGTDTIMGAASFTINVAYQMFEFVKVGTDWKFSGGVGEGAGGEGGLDLGADYAWTGAHSWETAETNVTFDSGGIGLTSRLAGVDRAGIKIRTDQQIYLNVGSETGLKQHQFHSDGSIDFAGGITTKGVTAASSGAEQIIMKDVDATDVLTLNTFLGFRDNLDVRHGYIGFGSAGNSDFTVSAHTGNVVLNSPVGLEIDVPNMYFTGLPIMSGLVKQWAMGSYTYFADYDDGTRDTGLRAFVRDGLMTVANYVGGVTDNECIISCGGNPTSAYHLTKKSYTDVNQLDTLNLVADAIDAGDTIALRLAIAGLQTTLNTSIADAELVSLNAE
jgi:hypothetical protein